MATDVEEASEDAEMLECKVCTHPDRDDLEEKMAGGILLKSTLAKELGVQTENVFIHQKEHIAKRIKKDVKKDSDLVKLQNKRDILITNLQKLNDRLLGYLDMSDDKSMTATHTSQIVKMMAEVRHHIETVAELEGELTKEKEITLIQYNELRAFVVQSLCPGCAKKMADTEKVTLVA